MTMPDDLIAHFLRQRESLQQQARMLRSGELQTGERTKEHPQWRDTTDESLKQVQREIGDIEVLLATHGYTGD